MASQRMAKTQSLCAPHQSIEPANARDRLIVALLDLLWDEYRRRVPFAQAYERVVAEAGATFVNDHVAFRTIAFQKPASGISSIGRLFESLGYEPAGTYVFPDKHLSSIHFQHPRPGFPKLFISELRTWELDKRSRAVIARSAARHRPLLTDDLLAKLSHGAGVKETSRIARNLATMFSRPWPAPERRDVLALNKVSQFGAWVLLHGYAVNHFTALVNSHGVESLNDIEKTVAAMRQAGVPMKSEIEGTRGSKLRQTATEAAVLSVRARDRGRSVLLPWTYAYFEIAERGVVLDPSTGRSARFEGFLGPQATQLFEMTRFPAT